MSPDGVSSSLAELLVCPVCAHELSWSSTEATCRNCGRRFPVVDSVPVLVRHAAHAGTGTDAGDGQKLRQAVYFDMECDPEFEVERPVATPRLYGWLLAERYRRGTLGLEHDIANGRVLVLCAGSGMDGEFVARHGVGHVILCDISLGAMQRAGERAQRHGVSFETVVADAEQLPFRTDSVDVTFVHDGLHHLEDPLTAVSEMARVARRAVSITEPARAAVTGLAMRVGLALEEEEAGNRVARLRLRDVRQELTRFGFTVLTPHRYGMYYRHEPGRAVRFLSRRRLLAPSELAFDLLNRWFGRFGNKMALQAVTAGRRPSRPEAESDVPDLRYL